MTELSLALMLLLSGAAGGEPWVCSIRTDRDSTVSGLLARVNIPYAEAAKVALASLRGPAEIIPPGDLAIKHACLVYTFSIRSADSSIRSGDSLRLVHVDAGNGKLVSRQRNAAAAPTSPLAVETPPAK